MTQVVPVQASRAASDGNGNLEFHANQAGINQSP